MTDSTFTKNFCPTSALIKQFHRGKFSNYFSLMQVFHSKKLLQKLICQIRHQISKPRHTD